VNTTEEVTRLSGRGKVEGVGRDDENRDTLDPFSRGGGSQDPTPNVGIIHGQKKVPIIPRTGRTCVGRDTERRGENCTYSAEEEMHYTRADSQTNIAKALKRTKR